MIFYSIEAALSLGDAVTVLVSTDDHEIQDLVRKNFPQVKVHERDISIAQDNTPTSAVIKSIMDLKLFEDHFVWGILQPTSPLRTSAQVKEAFSLLVQSAAESLVSVEKIPYHLEHLFTLENSKKELSPVLDWGRVSTKTQDATGVYSLNGAIYLFTPDYFKRNLTFFDSKSIAYVMDSTSSVDIDNLEDFLRAERLLQRRDTHS